MKSNARVRSRWWRPVLKGIAMERSKLLSRLHFRLHRHATTLDHFAARKSRKSSRRSRHPWIPWLTMCPYTNTSECARARARFQSNPSGCESLALSPSYLNIGSRLADAGRPLMGTAPPDFWWPIKMTPWANKRRASHVPPPRSQLWGICRERCVSGPDRRSQDGEAARELANGSLIANNADPTERREKNLRSFHDLLSRACN